MNSNITDKEYLKSIGLQNCSDFEVVRDEDNNILGVMMTSGQNQCMNGKLLTVTPFLNNSYKGISLEVTEDDN